MVGNCHYGMIASFWVEVFGLCGKRYCIILRLSRVGVYGGLAGWTYGTISSYGLSGSQVRFEWSGISYYLFDVSDSWCLVRVGSHSMIVCF